MFEICKEFSFEAAHYLPLVPEDHKCGKMHGHSYRFKVFLRGENNTYDLGAEGFLMDYADLSKCVKETIVSKLDHKVLNDVPGLRLSPTAEMLAYWIYLKLKPELPQLYKITVMETATTEASFWE